MGRRRLALAPFAVALLFVGGCNTRPCAEGTLFLTVAYDGAAAAADTVEIALSVGGRSARQSSRGRTPGQGTDTLELAFPGGYPGGQEVRIALTARQGGVVVGAGSASLTPKAGCDTAAIFVGPAHPGGADAAVDGPAADGRAGDGGAEDFGQSLDLLGDGDVGRDLASAELAGDTDLATDFAALTDQAQGLDSAIPADLAIPDLAAPDLAIPDLASVDFSTPPDLSAAGDLAQPPDLVLCECSPGAIRSVPCSNCGTQTDSCGNNCKWTFGTCLNQGECAVGAKRNLACGNCGTQTDTCGNNCRWAAGACGGQGCQPGSSVTQSCNLGGTCKQTLTLRCNQSCQYVAEGTCVNSGNECSTDTFQKVYGCSCRQGYVCQSGKMWRNCMPNCRWSLCYCEDVGNPNSSTSCN